MQQSTANLISIGFAIVVFLLTVFIVITLQRLRVAQAAWMESGRELAELRYQLIQAQVKAIATAVGVDDQIVWLDNPEQLN